MVAKMLSITAAARRCKLPRDTVLNAVHRGDLAASRDRRGVVRIDLAELERFLAVPCQPAVQTGAILVELSVMPADRLGTVILQQRRLLQALSGV